MVPLDLLLSILITLCALQGVQSRPSAYYAIDLRSCGLGSTNTTALEQCASVCQPVQEAQMTCNGRPECSCTKAPPNHVQSCLECHMNISPDIRRDEAALVIPSKLTEYSSICETFGLSTVPPPNAHPPPSIDGDIPPLTRRDLPEGDICVFGLPEIIFPESSSLLFQSFSTSRNPWLYLSLVVVVFMCVVHYHWKSK